MSKFSSNFAPFIFIISLTTLQHHHISCRVLEYGFHFGGAQIYHYKDRSLSTWKLKMFVCVCCRKISGLLLHSCYPATSWRTYNKIFLVGIAIFGRLLCFSLQPASPCCMHLCHLGKCHFRIGLIDYALSCSSSSSDMNTVTSICLISCWK